MTSSLDAVLQQYENNTSNNNNNGGMSREDRLKKYFVTILGDNESSGRRKIRILPTKDGSSPFKEVWYHEVQVDGKWLKIYDPAKNENGPSPLNDLYEELMSTGKESDKEMAKQYRSRKFYIVKVIDRDAEDEGVKFWRFKHNYRNEGILDKIIPIWREKGDVTNPETGRDLVIQLTKQKSSNGRPYTTVQAIMHDDPSPLSEDKELATEWLEDTLTHEDVYSQKPIEYLEAIARGETPRWDSNLGKFVYGDEEVSTDFGGTVKTEKEVDPQEDEDVSEDLPF